MSSIGLKIVKYDSIATCISIIRRYKNVSMNEIKADIETNKFAYTCSYTSDTGVRKLRKCYDELTQKGIEVEIYAHDQLADRQLLSNLLTTYKEIEDETWAQMDAEARTEGDETD